MSWLWNSAEKRNFNVLIYEEDYKELCAWVLKKPNIETGGDLFGLWADKHTAVIQLVLGPGKQCTRTTASFYQDIDYLRRVGSHLTQNEGVCHIGEWHSHHQLGLASPSGGDQNTVWNNMPTYNLKRFVIFIANIQSSKHNYNVNVGCFLFEIDDQGKHMDVLPGKFTILQKNSPLSGKREVTEERKKGAEKDDENEISNKELKIEMNEEGKRPSVTYLKPIPAPSERKRGNSNRGKHSQLENQNKPNREESSTDSKKRKMNTGEKSPHKTPGNGKKSGEGSPPSEDLENLTINNEQPEEQSEEAMEQEQVNEQPVKNSQEEIKHEEQHDGESGKSQGEKAGKIDKNNEASPPQAEQGNTEKEGKQRPLPKLGTEPTPEAKTQKQKEDEEQAANRRAAQSGATTEETLDSKDDPSQGSNKRKKKEEEGSQEAIEEQDEKELQEKKNQEELSPDEQYDGEEGKSQFGRKAENIKGKAGSPQAEQGKAEKESKPIPLPKPGKETKPEAKTQKKKAQDKEIPKTRAPQSGATKTGPSQSGSTKNAKKQK